MKIFNKIFGEKKAKGKSFFDLSSREKKKIVREAARESNKLQLELVKKYTKGYSFN